MRERDGNRRRQSTIENTSQRTQEKLEKDRKNRSTCVKYIPQRV